MSPNEVALLLMAGGRSERFGSQDKLTTDLNGRPLAMHVAKRLVSLTWARRIAVTGERLAPSFEKLGYEVVEAGQNSGLGDNIRVAAQNLPSPVCTLIVLADMPFVTAEHIEAMLAVATGPRSIVCTRGPFAATPPTLIGKAHFHKLLTLAGDEGAKSVVQGSPDDVTFVEVSSAVTADIDTRVDLEKWQRK